MRRFVALAARDGRRLAVGLLLCALFALTLTQAAAASSPTDPTGAWNVSFTGTNNPGTAGIHMVVTDTASSISGEAFMTSATESFATITGSASAGNVSFLFTYGDKSAPPNKTLSLTGTLEPSGNHMSGHWTDSEGNSGEWEAMKGCFNTAPAFLKNVPPEAICAKEGGVEGIIGNRGGSSGEASNPTAVAEQKRQVEAEKQQKALSSSCNRSRFQLLNKITKGSLSLSFEVTTPGTLKASVSFAGFGGAAMSSAAEVRRAHTSGATHGFVVTCSGAAATGASLKTAKKVKRYTIASVTKTFTHAGRVTLRIPLNKAGKALVAKLTAADKSYRRKHPHGHNPPTADYSVTLAYTPSG